MQAMIMAKLISTLAQVEISAATQGGSSISSLKSRKWKRRSEATQTLCKVVRVSYHQCYTTGMGAFSQDTQGKDKTEPELLLPGQRQSSQNREWQAKDGNIQGGVDGGIG